MCAPLLQACIWNIPVEEPPRQFCCELQPLYPPPLRFMLFFRFLLQRWWYIQSRYQPHEGFCEDGPPRNVLRFFCDLQDRFISELGHMPGHHETLQREN
jgi:hypothetical protein